MVLHGDKNRSRPLAIIALTSLALLVGCGPSSSGQSSEPVNVGVVAPFTGNQAFIGGFFGQACQAAAYVVDKAGGVLHRHMTCVHIDNTGDPADAGPNVARALATDSNLDLAVGLDSATAAVTVPLVERAHVPLITLNGLSEYDHNQNQYFWRVEPDDTNEGAALAAYASQKGYTKVALVFANLGSAQSEVSGATNGLKNLGIKSAISLTIPSDAASYESEVLRVIASHPQAIVMDGDPQSETTFFTQYNQLSKGKVPPLITTTDLLSTSFTTALTKNISKSFVQNDIGFLGYYFSNNAAAMSEYKTALGKLLPAKQVATDLTLSGLPTEYDGVIIAALAMTMAGSSSGPRYNADILKVTQASSGATVVHTYAQGLQALKAGKKIQYVGVDGAFAFNASHNVSGQFQVFAQTTSSGSKTIATVSPATIAKALG
jgi:ABC-type branched-subunit amino acid transport system substrate-binding protein